ncbi:glycosyltransferase family 2 protein [Kaarinaea lacus]
MLNGKKIVVVMPAYNAAKTLERTYRELPHDVIDEVVLVDDRSNDETAELAHSIGINHIIVHDRNLGYGGNQKTCYKHALDLGADVVIMVHPDYQYTPKLCRAMASIIAEGIYECVLGSRILGTGALKGGMPWYKYIANRGLTAFQNLMLSYKLSEYHTGYRAFSKNILQTLPLEFNSNNFVFDNQMLAQIIYAGYEIGEVTCPTKYMDEASSINIKNSIIYGLGVIRTSMEYRANKMKLIKSKKFASIIDKGELIVSFNK